MDIIKNEDIKRGLAELGIDCDAEIGRRERGYGIKGGNGKFCVEYAAKTDFFRAATILESIKDTKESVDISAENRFDTCGIMIDVSRNAVLKIETVKDIIRYMARMGLNMLMLYTEDTYKMEDYPYFGSALEFCREYEGSLRHKRYSYDRRGKDLRVYREHDKNGARLL